MILKRILKKCFAPTIKSPIDAVVFDASSAIRSWEEDYLVQKVRNRYSNVPEENIRTAVKSCYAIFRSPQSAEKMVDYVIAKISREAV